MKICLIVTGAIRISYSDMLKCIMTTKSNFSFCEVYVIFCTWKPIVKTYISWGLNYYYDYDYDEYKNVLESHVDKVLFMENLDIDNVIKLRNWMPPLFMYQIGYVKDYIEKNNLEFDYIIKTRNELELVINNTEKYLNEFTYVPPAYWRTDYVYDLLNDHFFIMPYKKFMSLDLSNNTIEKITNNYGDCEDINKHVMKPDFCMDNQDIKLYNSMGTCKVYIKN